MANLKDIKRRIGSVKSTQKITNAMKLVSAAKFARASNAAEAARPYAKALDRVVQKLLVGQAELESPLLRQSEEKRALVLMLGTDRGLCGGLNSNLAKAVNAFIKEKSKEGVKLSLYAGGRRSIAFGKKWKIPFLAQREKVLEGANIGMARELAAEVLNAFRDSNFDRVYMAFPYFKSALDQTPTIVQLLPIPMALSESESSIGPDLIVEPGVEELLDKLLERKLISTVFSALLSAVASEHGSRMTAMDSATNNAKEVIRKLTLQYNRARQAAITKELIEIISGAEAL